MSIEDYQRAEDVPSLTSETLPKGRELTQIEISALSIKKSGRAREGKMSTQAIYFLMSKRARYAGIEAFTPHDLRRTFVSDLLDAGADIVTIAKMAGHENINTTAQYDRRSEEIKRKTAELLKIPFFKNNS